MPRRFGYLVIAGAVFLTASLGVIRATSRGRPAGSAASVAAQPFEIKTYELSITDEATMILVGSALIGLAAVVRRGA
jgi:hypothetical protein